MEAFTEEVRPSVSGEKGNKWKLTEYGVFRRRGGAAWPAPRSYWMRLPSETNTRLVAEYLPIESQVDSELALSRYVRTNASAFIHCAAQCVC